MLNSLLRHSVTLGFLFALGTAASTHVQADRCFKKLSAPANQLININRNGDFVYKDNCFEDLVCFQGKQKYVDGQQVICEPDANTKCTASMYKDGLCSENERTGTVRRAVFEGEISPRLQDLAQGTSPGDRYETGTTTLLTCDETLTIKPGQVINLNRRQQVVYRDKCYSKFTCSSGSTNLSDDNKMRCDVTTVRPAQLILPTWRRSKVTQIGRPALRP